MPYAIGNWFKLKNCEGFLHFLKKKKRKTGIRSLLYHKNMILGAAGATVEL